MDTYVYGCAIGLIFFITTLSIYGASFYGF